MHGTVGGQGRDRSILPGSKGRCKDGFHRSTWKWDHIFENVLDSVLSHVVLNIHYFFRDNQKSLKWIYYIYFILLLNFWWVWLPNFFSWFILFLWEVMRMWSRSFVRTAPPAFSHLRKQGAPTFREAIIKSGFGNFFCLPLFSLIRNLLYFCHNLLSSTTSPGACQ